MTTTSPPLELSHLSPFCSVILWSLVEAEMERDELVDRVIEIIPSAIRKTRQRGHRLSALTVLDTRTVGQWRVGGAWHVMATAPSWLRRERPDTPDQRIPPIKDRRNHLSLFLASDTMAAFLVTDTRVRPPIAEFLQLLAIKPVPPELATDAFLTGSARQLWLRGVHQPVSTRADAKSLIGPDLREAIDPFGDQTFTLDAAVSAPRMVAIANDLYRALPDESTIRTLDLADALGRPPRNAGSPVGYSVRKGTLWSRPTSSISDLTYELDRLVRLLQRTGGDVDEARGFQQHGYSHLLQAEPTAEIDTLGKPVDFSLYVDELEPEHDRDWDLDDDRQRHDWLEHGEMRLLAPGGSEPDTSCAFVAAQYDGETIATLRVQPILLPGGRADINLTVIPADSSCPDDDARIEYPLSLVRSRAAIWFDSGHALRDGHIYRLQYRDVPFDRWRWIRFGNYTIDTEKPPEPLSEHDWQGSSLFDYIVNNAVEVFEIDPDDDWHMFCDDGSLEIADFVFVNSSRKQLRLVHVKAASSALDREIAPAKYEVVTSQAEKNLRFADPKILAKYLRDRTFGRSGIKPIERACWHNGELTQNLDSAIAAIEALGGFPDRGIVLFQPHTGREVWRNADHDYRQERLTPAQQVQFLRLRTLLAGLDDICRKTGVTFMAIGHDQPTA